MARVLRGCWAGAHGYRRLHSDREQRLADFDHVASIHAELRAQPPCRTLTAVDSAVAVLDAAKAIEEQTRNLFEVCRLRDVPIITFRQ